VLPVSNDLHALIAQLPTRQELIGVHHSLPEAMGFLENFAGNVVLKTALTRWHRTYCQVRFHATNNTMQCLEIPPADQRLTRRGQVHRSPEVVARCQSSP
jgi:hypothetical protein